MTSQRSVALPAAEEQVPEKDIALPDLRRQSESRKEPKPLSEIVDQGDGGRSLVALGKGILRDRVQALKPQSSSSPRAHRSTNGPRSGSSVTSCRSRGSSTLANPRRGRAASFKA